MSSSVDPLVAVPLAAFLPAQPAITPSEPLGKKAQLLLVPAPSKTARSKGTSSLRKSHRREVILNVAARIVSCEGPEELTFRRLSEELQCVPGALYRYFSSKEAIFQAVWLRALREAHLSFTAECGMIDSMYANCSAPQRVLTRVLWLAYHAASLPAQRPDIFRLHTILSQTVDPESVVPIPFLLEPWANLLASWSEIFRQAQEAGVLSPGDPRERTMVLWMFSQGLHCSMGVPQHWVPVEYSRHLQHVCKATVHALLIGWGADPRELDVVASGLPEPECGTHSD